MTVPNFICTIAAAVPFPAAPGLFNAGEHVSRPVSNIAGVATLATNLYDQIRSEVLTGRLEPGRKLQIEFLSERYGAGQTPVREALNRLTSDGLVERREQRGFAVCEVSPADLAEITKTRCWLEEIALRESIEARTPAWEEELVLAEHRLRKTPRSLSADHYEENPEWERLHRAFHRALIGNCGSVWLIAFCEKLADQLYRYRQLAVKRTFQKRHESTEHREIIDAAIAGDSVLAVSLLTGHFRKTAAAIIDDPVLVGRLGK
ncbi:GntR family transcriptional regulator [soil metagenome]